MSVLTTGMVPRMHDLTGTAGANHDQRVGDASALIAADPSRALAAFETLVAASVMTTNVTADKVLAFDDASEILDARRIAIAAEGGDTGRGLSRFAKGSWAPRREAFEDLWTDGRSAVYGAVNIGGPGAGFGDFCLVIESPDVGATGVAVFPGDSAQRYTDPASDVDEGAVLDEATAWDDRAALAVVERADDVQSRPSSEWPTVLCSPDRYLETVRLGALPLSAIASVRLASDERSELRSLRSLVVRGQTVSPTDRRRAAAYAALYRWRRSLGVAIETV
ncbi:MAG: hypothetical protein K8R99_10115 [Actinomycetia bacterium]|nr:hypothetical protein [Actinomycetes bacterium]